MHSDRAGGMEFSISRNALSIILDGVVSGPSDKHRITMVLDTGASNCMIPYKVAKKIGYEVTENGRCLKIHSANGLITTPVIAIDEIEVLVLKVKDIDVICHDLSSGAYVDGLLGLNFLRHFKVTIDFPNGKLILE